MALAALFITLGLLFVIAEVFIPSGGILGFIAFAFLVAALVFGFRDGANAGLLVMLAELVVVPASIAFAFWVLPRTAFGRSVILSPPEAETVASQQADVQALLHKIGTTATPHHPSGISTIDDRRHDTIAETGTIDADVSVKVVRIEGDHLFVRPVKPEELAEDSIDIDPTDEFEGPLT